MKWRRFLCRIGYHGPLRADLATMTDNCPWCGKSWRLFYIWPPSKWGQRP